MNAKVSTGEGNSMEVTMSQPSPLTVVDDGGRGHFCLYVIHLMGHFSHIKPNWLTGKES